MQTNIEFNVGDWTTYLIQDNPIGRIIGFGEDDFIKIDIGNNTLFVPSQYLKHWHPKEDDWVIYNGSIEENKFEVLKVKEFNKNTNKVYFGGEECNLYVYLHEVQPFLGTLPNETKCKNY